MSTQDAAALVGPLAILGMMALAYAAVFIHERPRTAIIALALATGIGGFGLGVMAAHTKTTHQENTP